MKKIEFVLLCLGFFSSVQSPAQMYTVTDLGTLGGYQSQATGINASGQVVGYSLLSTNTIVHAFRTAPNRPINSDIDDLGTLGGGESWAYGINDSGQVVGHSWTVSSHVHAFRTAPNSPINPAKDDLGSFMEYGWNPAVAINTLGQVVGDSIPCCSGWEHAFRTAPNTPIDAADNLGTLAGGWSSAATGINDSGQVVGGSSTSNFGTHAFRTAPNSAINPATDDLGTLGGFSSTATGINVFGQVVGCSEIADQYVSHAFRTAPNSAINPATDDLGSLVDKESCAYAIDDFGQVVGAASYGLSFGPIYIPGWIYNGWTFNLWGYDSHAFLYSGRQMHDLNTLVEVQSGCEVVQAIDINNSGQIAANRICSGLQHAVLLDPIYKAVVQQPINAEGSSVFSARRGVIPVKFRLTQYGQSTCTLLPAVIAVVKAGNGTLAPIDESIFAAAGDSSSNFRIDPTACQYVYNLGSSHLGPGTYRIDISINHVFVGHAVFSLR